MDIQWWEYAAAAALLATTYKIWVTFPRATASKLLQGIFWFSVRAAALILICLVTYLWSADNSKPYGLLLAILGLFLLWPKFPTIPHIEKE